MTFIAFKYLAAINIFQFSNRPVVFFLKVTAMAIETMEVLMSSIPMTLMHMLVVTWMDTCHLDMTNQAVMTMYDNTLYCFLFMM